MARRCFFWLMVFAAGAPIFARAASKDRPHILFLFADDLCFQSIGAWQQTDIDTPNLDRLAGRGTSFRRAYNMGSWTGAVCVASRAMLITGRSLWDARAVHPQMERERQAGALWPQLLKQAGYRTYGTGKWHIPVEAAACFDVVRHIRGAMPGTHPSAYHRPREGESEPWRSDDRALGGYWEGGRHWSEVTADDAIDFFTDAKGREQPSFFYVAFNAPHDPRQAPTEYLERYPLSRIKAPSNFLDAYPYREAIGCAHELRDESLAPMPRTKHAVQVHRQEYYALITHLDAQIGRILDALERSGLADKTWICFTADHGLAIGQHGLFGKQNVYDHSVRVPLIVAGPGLPKNRSVEAAVYLQDAVPTTLEMAGVERPRQMFFRSLGPFLRETERKSEYPAVYGAYLDLQRAVTWEGWKLIAYPKASKIRLFDLAHDPHEQHDLADDLRHAARKRQCFHQLIALQKEMGDTLDIMRTFKELAAGE